MLYNSLNYKGITGAHVHLGDDLAEFFHSFGVGFGVFVQQGCGHLCVAMYAWVVLEAEALDGSRFDDSFPDCCARFASDISQG